MIPFYLVPRRVSANFSNEPRLFKGLRVCEPSEFLNFDILRFATAMSANLTRPGWGPHYDEEITAARVHGCRK